VTPVGILIALLAIVVSMTMEHGHVGSLIKISPLLLVVGGSLGATMAGFELRKIRTIPGALKVVMKRRKGMKKGIQLIVSTSDPDRVYELMAAEIEGLRTRHRTGTKFFSDMAGYSPTFGILGTVIGLISVLGQLSSPGKLGPAIAAAFTATLWGVLLANAVWLPISNKLRRLSEEEISYREMVIEGLLTMQLNASTTELKDRLDAFLPPSQRDQAQTRAPLEEVPDAAA
jgi:chemotaxis protein MotA